MIIPFITFETYNQENGEFLKDMFANGEIAGACFKSFNLDNFESLTRQFCYSFHDVGTRQSLKERNGDGFTTMVHEKNFCLLGHSEGHYRPYPQPPTIGFFACLTAPPRGFGGETSFVDGNELLALLSTELRDRLYEGITYECLWPRERWSVEFGTQDVLELKSILATQEGMEFEMQDDFLHFFYDAPAIYETSKGEHFFSNGLLAHLPEIKHAKYKNTVVYANPKNRVYYRGRRPFHDDHVNELITAHDRVKHLHHWSQGDVVIFNNVRFIHGREMTTEAVDRKLFSRFGRHKSSLFKAICLTPRDRIH